MARVVHLTCTTSDHMPILVELLGPILCPSGQRWRQRIHRLEAMWLRDGRCVEVVKTNWACDQEGSMAGLRLNVEKSGSCLTQWGRTTFGHVQQLLRSKPNEVRRLEGLSVLSRVEYGMRMQLCREIGELLEREEILWCLGITMDNLSCGYSWRPNLNT
ncbi:unnamed protein product [Camellia sinensis]